MKEIILKETNDRSFKSFSDQMESDTMAWFLVKKFPKEGWKKIKATPQEAALFESKWNSRKYCKGIKI